jgi:hypothetical protein
MQLVTVFETVGTLQRHPSAQNVHMLDQFEHVERTEGIRIVLVGIDPTHSYCEVRSGAIRRSSTSCKSYFEWRSPKASPHYSRMFLCASRSLPVRELCKEMVRIYPLTLGYDFIGN